METKELLLTSCRHTQNWSICLWDYNSTNILHYYRNGGVVSPKSLNLIGNDYILTIDNDKPIIYVWLLNSQEPIKKQQTILPKRVQLAVICPNFQYLAGAIDTNLYLWSLINGKLLTIQKRNYQAITCIQFTNDSRFVIIGGKDGLLVIYELLDLINIENRMSTSDLSQIEPYYIKHDHSMAITDLCTNQYGIKSRLITVSCDQTCKIYNLQTGQLLLNLIFTEILTCIKIDNTGWYLFIGTNTGKIFNYHLNESPRLLLDDHININNNNKNIFNGHEKRIVCLDLNHTNIYLVSGSDDCFVFIWDIKSRQILKRLEHKDEITNVRFVLNYQNFFQQTYKPKLILKNLERELNTSDIFIDNKYQDYDIHLSDNDDDDDDDNDKIVDKSKFDSNLLSENLKLRAINQQLYDVAVKISKKYNKF